jgi:hypothetical protein
MFFSSRYLCIGDRLGQGKRAGFGVNPYPPPEPWLDKTCKLAIAWRSGQARMSQRMSIAWNGTQPAQPFIYPFKAKIQTLRAIYYTFARLSCNKS